MGTPTTSTARPALPLTADGRLSARARLLGSRINLRALAQAEGMESLAAYPLTLSLGRDSVSVLFRFGAVVCFGPPGQQEDRLLERLAPLVSDPLPVPEREHLDIRIEPGGRDLIESAELVMPDLDLTRLQVVADILAKSVLLASYETGIAQTFDRIEPLAEHLQRHGRGSHQGRELLRHIGATLQIQQRMVGRAEVGEKPEILWDRPDLERLFLRLEHEYELRERQRALDRKLQVIGDTAQTLLDLLQNNRTLRVEWYIVLLIVVEIALTLYELLLPSH